MKPAFVVIGESGEYSSRYVWAAAVFLVEHEATDFATACERVWIEAGRPDDCAGWKHPLDVHWRGDTAGEVSRWRVESTVLLGVGSTQ